MISEISFNFYLFPIDCYRGLTKDHTYETIKNLQIASKNA